MNFNIKSLIVFIVSSFLEIIQIPIAIKESNLIRKKNQITFSGSGFNLSFYCILIAMILLMISLALFIIFKLELMLIFFTGFQIMKMAVLSLIAYKEIKSFRFPS